MGSSVISTEPENTNNNSEHSINPCLINGKEENNINNNTNNNNDNNNNNNNNTTTYDADFYNTETPTERHDRIKALFDSLDKKKEGVLDRECIEKGLTAMTHLPARTKFVNELLAQCDTSQDGLVDFDEFKTYVHEKEKELWQLFQRLDTRGDGSLLPSDLAGALQASGITVTQEELMEFVQWMDLDGNGVIDFYEFKNFLLLLPETKVSEIYRYYETSTQLTQDGEVIIPPTDETSHHALRYLLAGGIAGAVSRTCTAPFDRLKVYLITNGSQSQSLTIREAIKIIYAKSGWRGFFVGNGLNIFKIVPESAIKFYSYETFKGIFAKALDCEDKDSIPTGARFLAGGMAGICSQFLIYPVETLKTRIMSLQRENAKTATAIISSSSTTTSASATATTNLSSAYTSSSYSPSSAYTTASASSFPINSNTKSSTISSRMSQSIVINTIKAMYARAGLRAFWPGLTLGLVGVFPYQAMDLGIYESLKLKYLHYTDEGNLRSDKPKQPSVFVLWACGMISGSIGASSVYPLNVIRTRLQAQGTPAHPRYYTSPWNAVQVTFQTEGIRGFYKGLGPTLLKVVPAVSISYITYEWSKRELGIS